MKRMAIWLTLVVMLTSLLPAGAQSIAMRSSVENWWDVTGLPQLEASVMGQNEFERGDTSILKVELTNYGQITDHEPDEKPEDVMERALTDREFTLEGGKTTALTITGTLRSLSEFIEVQSGEQIIESLPSGQRSSDPMEFEIEIDNFAPAGEYTMVLDLFYDYQENVQVGAEGYDPVMGLRGFRQSSTFERIYQSINLPVVVKRKADFEVVNVDSDLNAGEKDAIIKITYKNIGEEPTKDAIVRISIFSPFSSADDQAYLGTLEPEEEKTVIFKLDVNDDATIGNYSINSEVKYTDLKGNSVKSENVNFPVNVGPAEKSYKNVVILAVIALAIIGGYILKKKKT